MQSALSRLCKCISFVKRLRPLFSLLFQKLAASLEKCPHHFVLFQAFCLRGQNAWNIFHLFHNWNSIQVNQTYIPSFVFLLQNKVLLNEPWGQSQTWNFTCDEPTVHERLFIIAMEHNRSSSFYSEFRSDIIMKASSALIRREKRSRQEITFKGSDHR